MYGDRDPEDAYDAGDPYDARLAVLERTIADLEWADGDDRTDARADDVRRLLAILARHRGPPDPRLDELQLRLDQL